MFDLVQESGVNRHIRSAVEVTIKNEIPQGHAEEGEPNRRERGQTCQVQPQLD
jgi:hypothetical protein